LIPAEHCSALGHPPDPHPLLSLSLIFPPLSPTPSSPLPSSPLLSRATSPRLCGQPASPQLRPSGRACRPSLLDQDGTRRHRPCLHRSSPPPYRFPPDLAFPAPIRDKVVAPVMICTGSHHPLPRSASNSPAWTPTGGGAQHHRCQQPTRSIVGRARSGKSALSWRQSSEAELHLLDAVVGACQPSSNPWRMAAVLRVWRRTSSPAATPLLAGGGAGAGAGGPGDWIAFRILYGGPDCFPVFYART
jgi:hypothetical protein